MGLRDRLEAGTTRIGTTAREATASAGEAFRGLRAMVEGDDEQPISIERFLLALVRTVRDEESAEERSTRDVFETARRRQRRLGLASFGAGPLVGLANELSDLYSETATVCDLADVHDLNLDDEQIAAHMLVLWCVTPKLDEAQAAIDGTGGSSVAAILGVRLRERADTHMPEKLTKRSVTKALWEARGVVGEAREGREGAGRGAVRTVVFPGKRTKQFIKKAEVQLGVA